MATDINTGISTQTKLDTTKIKTDFPILKELIHNQRLVYLDNAASTQKPQVVLNAHTEFLSHMNANIHRGLHTLAERSTNAYEKTRLHTAKFIGGVKPQEIIFTAGTTEAINLVAYTWGEKHIHDGDEIVLSEMEHHANLVPWVILAKKKNAVIKRIPLTADGLLDLTDIDNIITEKTKLVAVAHMSNVLGTINPIKFLADKAHRVGALLLADGAQAAPHLPVNVKELGVDFYALRGQIVAKAAAYYCVLHSRR